MIQDTLVTAEPSFERPHTAHTHHTILRRTLVAASKHPPLSILLHLFHGDGALEGPAIHLDRCFRPLPPKDPRRAGHLFAQPKRLAVVHVPARRPHVRLVDAAAFDAVARLAADPGSPDPRVWAGWSRSLGQLLAAGGEASPRRPSCFESRPP